MAEPSGTKILEKRQTPICAEPKVRDHDNDELMMITITMILCCQKIYTVNTRHCPVNDTSQTNGKLLVTHRPAISVFTICQQVRVHEEKTRWHPVSYFTATLFSLHVCCSVCFLLLQFLMCYNENACVSLFALTSYVLYQSGYDFLRCCITDYCYNFYKCGSRYSTSISYIASGQDDCD